jgi:hypothetical protein
MRFVVPCRIGLHVAFDVPVFIDLKDAYALPISVGTACRYW